MENLDFNCKEAKGDWINFNRLRSGDILVTVKNGGSEMEIVIDKYEALEIIQFLGGTL